MPVMAAGRFAPSPTAALHLGNLRTALLAWLFARSADSRFVVRLEDLDPAASSRSVAEDQLADLRRLGLDWDGPVESQRDHRPRFEAAITALQDAGLTYPCFCTRREIQQATVAPHGPAPEGAYPGTCRDLSLARRAELEADGRRAALRLRADGLEVEVVDRLHGTVRAVVDDFVLRRNDGLPAYNLAVVVDDAAQGIDEIVRGDDLLMSTPRQAHLHRLLGHEVPAYAHVPLVLGPTGERLAKRDGAVTLRDRESLGESAGDVRSWLAASLGLAEAGEAIGMAVLLERFDPSALPREPWVLSASR
jgi:glutamyl-tRNA synthetase